MVYLSQRRLYMHLTFTVIIISIPYRRDEQKSRFLEIDKIKNELNQMQIRCN